jgi:hypothetical protein
VSEIVTPADAEPGDARWRAVRHHFGIMSFGISAYASESAGDRLVGDHTEVDTRHEELFYIASGHAAVRVGNETVDAPSGTFVYIEDPAELRGATALEPGTIMIAVGGEPGQAYQVSLWERKHTDGG